jgi:predicted RNA-binding Zn ribbon-like protein
VRWYQQNQFHRNHAIRSCLWLNSFCWYNEEVQSIHEVPFVAGHSALDFVNTAEGRGHPAVGEALLTEADLRAWGQRYGLIARSLKLDDQAHAELERARVARELLYSLFFARAHRRAVSKRDVARLAELAADAYRAASLRVDADGGVSWHWLPSKLTSVRHVVVTSAVELLHAEPSSRLKQCPGDHCGWFFLDTTKRGNRRWCQMRECGQEAKDERRRQRRHAGRRPASASS